MAFPNIPGLRLGTGLTLGDLFRQAGSPTVPTQDAPMPVGATPGIASPGNVPPQVPPADENPEIVVQNEPYPKSKYRNGIVQGGTFRLGGLGGNILGALGDAFLIQSGNAPRYAPRLQQARVSEALENFQTDPERAIGMLMQIDPEAATRLYQSNFENQLKTNEDERQGEELGLRRDVTGAQVRASNTQTDSVVRDRLASMFGQATEQTFPAALSQAQAYAQRYGLDIPLPKTWQEARQWAREGIPAGTQIELNDRRDFQQGQLQNQRITAGARVTAANRPPASATRPPTSATVVGRLLDIVANGGTLTPAQQRIVDAYNPQNRPTGRRGGSPVRMVRGPDGRARIERVTQ